MIFGIKKGGNLMGKNEMGSPMNASIQSVKDRSDVEFGTGNVDDVRIEVKKSTPEASRYTESTKQRRARQMNQKR